MRSWFRRAVTLGPRRPGVEEVLRALAQASAAPPPVEGETAALLPAPPAADPAQSERLLALGTLSAGVAHEVNTPLTYILHSADVLLSPTPPSDARARLQAIRDGALRIRDLVRQLVTYARPSVAHREPVDVHAAVHAMVRFIDEPLAAKGWLELDLQPVPRVLAREQELGQVLLNLLCNALQALPAPPGVIRVSTRVNDAGRVELDVSDNGRGVPAAVRPRVFEAFFTTKPTGTGLGLFLSDRLMRELGGSVELLASPMGGGATFRLTLEPFAEPHAASPLRLLVVDDNPNLLRSLEFLLGDLAAEFAPSSEAALLALARERFDAVLCDVMMPGINGLDLYDRACAAEPAYAGRFVFMTGGATREDLQARLDALPGASLQKPFTREELLAALARLGAAAHPQ